MPSGRKLDIFAFDLIDGHIYIDIYELKKECINTDAVAQAYNYLVEIADLIKGNFKSFDIHIIMVGRRYEPIPVFEKMHFPFSVYTYDYQIDGMKFSLRQKVKREYHPNENFSMGLWAFGLNRLHFPNGQANTVNLEDIYKRWAASDTDFITALKKVKDDTVNPVIIERVVEYIHPKKVKTVIFPEQPGWSEEFLNGIPHTDMMEDFDIDRSDYELEQDNDESDFEPDDFSDNETCSYTPDEDEQFTQLNFLINDPNDT